MELPQNYQRIVDDFQSSLYGPDQVAGVLGELRSAKTPEELNEKIRKFTNDGGPSAELVGRIFSKPIDTSKGSGLRTVDHKALAENQVNEAGSGGVTQGHVPHERPHTSEANPPRPGHPVVKEGEVGGDTTEDASPGSPRIGSRASR